jgi:hypothetical protein
MQTEQRWPARVVVVGIVYPPDGGGPADAPAVAIAGRVGRVMVAGQTCGRSHSDFPGDHRRGRMGLGPARPVLVVVGPSRQRSTIGARLSSWRHRVGGTSRDEYSVDASSRVRTSAAG